MNDKADGETSGYESRGLTMGLRDTEGIPPASLPPQNEKDRGGSLGLI